MIMLVVHYIYTKKITPQSKTSNKDKRFTLMKVTTPIGKSLMCCVIFKGVRCYSETETGIDFTVKVSNHSNDQENFIKNNFENGEFLSEPLTGEGKLLPGGPTSMFKGKVVPCFIRWSEIRRYVFF